MWARKGMGVRTITSMDPFLSNIWLTCPVSRFWALVRFTWSADTMISVEAMLTATEDPDRVAQVLAEIEAATGLTVYDMPKLREFFVGLRFDLSEGKPA